MTVTVPRCWCGHGRRDHYGRQVECLAAGPVRGGCGCGAYNARRVDLGRLSRITWRAVKHLFAVRAALPRSVRWPLAVAAPFLALPGVPDFGIDEAALILAAVLLACRRRDRAQCRALWRACWHAGRLDIGP